MALHFFKIYFSQRTNSWFAENWPRWEADHQGSDG